MFAARPQTKSLPCPARRWRSAVAALALGCAAPLRAQQDLPRSAGLVSPEARAALATRAGAELAGIAQTLDRERLLADPSLEPVPQSAGLGAFSPEGERRWRDVHEQQLARLSAVDANILSPRARIDLDGLRAYCRRVLLEAQIDACEGRDVSRPLERIERCLRVFLLPHHAQVVAERAPVLRARVEALPATLLALHDGGTSSSRPRAEAALRTCARLVETLERELPALAAALPAGSPDRTALEAALPGALRAAREFSLWLANDVLPRCTRPAAVPEGAWIEVARARTGFGGTAEELELRLLGALSALAASAASVPCPPNAGETGSFTLDASAGLTATLISRGTRKVLQDAGIVPADDANMRVCARSCSAAPLELATRYATVDGSSWLEIGLPGAAWPAGLRAARANELCPPARQALFAIHGNAGAGLRVGRRASGVAAPLAPFADPALDVGFGLYTAFALLGLDVPDNPLHGRPAVAAALARAARLDCARLLAAVRLHVDEQASDAVLDEFAGTTGLDTETARLELDALRSDPWRGLPALGWLEFQSLERSVLASARTTAGASAGQRAALLRVVALSAEFPAARPADVAARVAPAR